MPPYAVANLRVTVNDMAPIAARIWLRGVSALPNCVRARVVTSTSWRTAAGADPVAYRLRHLHDARAAELVARPRSAPAGSAHTAPQQQPADGDWLHGQGFAYARYVHSKWPGFGAAWAAWVADVDVNRADRRSARQRASSSATTPG